MPEVKAFAKHGIEKMLYDVRMGPQAVSHDGVIYVVYQSNPDGPEGQPHIRSYDTARREWSDEVRVGTVARYDQHFAPILWIDHDEHLHILFGCHGRTGGTHIVSEAPLAIDRWKAAPEVYDSISYPRVFPLPDGRFLMYSRTYGHLGYWTYRMSDDGTYWRETRPLIDFDQDPQRRDDVWEATYQSVALDASGSGLHISYVRFSEEEGIRKRENPLYGRHVAHYGRHNLYYAHLNIDSNCLTTIDGEELRLPVTRSVAEAALVMDTGRQVTNPPGIADDGRGQPMMMLPFAGKASPWEGDHVFVRRVDGVWKQTPVASLNNTWSANWLMPREGHIDALLTRGEADGSLLSYGGGRVEQWTTRDGGETWSKCVDIEPEPGLICNNPRPVATSRGGILDGYYTLFGWEGPASLSKDSVVSSGDSRGMAFLYCDGEWL